MLRASAEISPTTWLDVIGILRAQVAKGATTEEELHDVTTREEHKKKLLPPKRGRSLVAVGFSFARTLFIES